MKGKGTAKTPKAAISDFKESFAGYVGRMQDIAIQNAFCLPYCHKYSCYDGIKAFIFMTKT